MIRHAPSDAGGEARQYECRDCLNRVTTEEHRVVCPECRGPLRNITVPRE